MHGLDYCTFDLNVALCQLYIGCTRTCESESLLCAIAERNRPFNTHPLTHLLKEHIT